LFIHYRSFGWSEILLTETFAFDQSNFEERRIHLVGDSCSLNISEKDLNNPWAICTASVGRKNRRKYERCVIKVKKRLGIK
jgi:hypothetical protein